MENAFTFLPEDPTAARTRARLPKAQLPRALLTRSAQHLCACRSSQLSQAAVRKKTHPRLFTGARGVLTAGRGLRSPRQRQRHHPVAHLD